MDEKQFSVQLHLNRNYRFTVEFGAGEPELVMDEPAPLGDAAGPNAVRVLGAAIGNCLAASLLYCLRKAQIDVTDLWATVEGTLARDARGRWRVGAVDVTLHPCVTQQSKRIDRCMELFEDFCIVTQSVREGVTVNVAVQPEVAATSLEPALNDSDTGSSRDPIPSRPR